MTRALWFLPVLLILGMIWFLAVSDRGARWLTPLFVGPDERQIVVGQILSAQGRFKMIRSGKVSAHDGPLSVPLEIKGGDKIETDRAARIDIRLNSQDELSLAPLSSYTFQLWNPTDASSPIYIDWHAGDLESTRKGVSGRAYLVREGRLYLLGQKPQDKPLALTVLKSAPLDLQLADSGEPDSEDTTDFEGDSTATTDTPTSESSEEESAKEEAPEVSGKDPETLSNEYIDEVMASRRTQFQKCWLTRLKENPYLRGQLTLQFEINRRGKVRELRAVDATFEDDQLSRCILTVVERISFRPFRGQEISLSYPITFE